MLVLPRMTAEAKDTLGWERRCIHALAAARRSASPAESLYRLLRDGCLDTTEAHHTLGNEQLTQPCHLSICGIQINDETFEREYKAVIERLCLSLLWQLVIQYKTITGAALTILVRHLTEALDSALDTTALEVLHAMMSKSCASPLTVTAEKRDFSYRPLPQDGASIRLLVLWPPGTNNQISCRLIYRSSLDGLQYEALSYVWGDTNDTVSILVNRKRFSVKTNLFQALKALQKPREARILWVDAICIDQANLSERSSQVAIMGKLYRQASKVIAWLGPEPKDGKMLFETLNGDMTVSEKCRPALQGLMDNFYFRRAWIVQEIALSQDVILQYGKISCPLKKLERHLSEELLSIQSGTLKTEASDEYENELVKQAFAKHPTRKLLDVSDIRSSHKNGTVQTILILTMRGRMSSLLGAPLDKTSVRVRNQEVLGDLLSLAGRSGCLDSKDKVFSMLEIYRIFTRQSQLLIEPDYQQSVEEIMINVARSIILSLKDLVVLSFAVQQHREDTSLLPSWVPDWRNGMFFEQVGHPAVPYDHAETLSVSFENHGRTLRVCGFEIDKIDSPIDIDFFDRYAFLESILTYIELEPCARSLHTYGTAAMWLAILFIASPDEFQSYSRPHAGTIAPWPSVSVSTPARAGTIAPAATEFLSSTKFPPQTPEAASYLAEKYWAWLQEAWLHPTERIFSAMRRKLRMEKVFTTQNGNYAVATAMANKGDVIVAFPCTSCLLALRNVGEYHFVVGVV
jgi:hypothetical protein